jgi:hypothetical protein
MKIYHRKSNRSIDINYLFDIDINYLIDNYKTDSDDQSIVTKSHGLLSIDIHRFSSIFIDCYRQV